MEHTQPIDRLRIPLDKPLKSCKKVPTKGACGSYLPKWKGSWTKGLGNYLLWAVIIGLLVFFILYFVDWEYFQDANGDPDIVKILIASLLVALVVVIILAWFSII